VKLNMNRVAAKVIYLLAVKYRISYEIGIPNKLMELGLSARFTKRPKRYSVLSSRPSNVLVMSSRPCTSSASSVKLIVLAWIMSAG
jgi:hypothetical protein